MNTLKKLGIAIICTVLVFILELASIMYCTNEIIKDGLMTETIKQGVKNKNPELANEIDKYGDIINTDGANDIINSIIKDYSEGGASDETVDKIIEFIKSNSETIKKMDKDVDIDELVSEESKKELKKSLDKTYSELDNSGNATVKEALTTYTKVVSFFTIKNMIITVFVLIGLLILISWSPYSWIKPLSKVFNSSAVMLLVFYLISVFGVNALLKGSDIRINTKSMLILGVIQLAIGIALYIIYRLIDKRVKANNEALSPEPVVQEINNIEETNNDTIDINNNNE